MRNGFNVRSLPGISTQDELRAHLLSKGCYSPDENLSIYTHWFSAGPRYLFRAVDRRYGLRDRKLCDIGCAYGTNLAYCVSGSYGIEIEQHEVDFARALGLSVYQRDLIHDDVSDLPKAEAAWCSAILEHVESPHIFLRKVWELLQPGGLAVIYVPTLPILPWLRKVPGLEPYLNAFEHGDHLSAFVPSTLRFICERAGFRTRELSPFYPGLLSVMNHLPLAQRLIGHCLYIGEKIDGWEYPESSTRRTAANSKGFVFKGQDFSTDDAKRKT